MLCRLRCLPQAYVPTRSCHSQSHFRAGTACSPLLPKPPLDPLCTAPSYSSQTLRLGCPPRLGQSCWRVFRRKHAGSLPHFSCGAACWLPPPWPFLWPLLAVLRSLVHGVMLEVVGELLFMAYSEGVSPRSHREVGMSWPGFLDFPSDACTGAGRGPAMLKIESLKASRCVLAMSVCLLHSSEAVTFRPCLSHVDVCSSAVSSRAQHWPMGWRLECG